MPSDDAGVEHLVTYTSVQKFRSKTSDPDRYQQSEPADFGGGESTGVQDL